MSFGVTSVLHPGLFIYQQGEEEKAKDERTIEVTLLHVRSEGLTSARLQCASRAPYSQRPTDGLPAVVAPSSAASAAGVVDHHHGHTWEAFWRDVKAKAGHGFQHGGPQAS